MESDPLKPLREVVDQEHAEAMRSLEFLGKYLANHGFTLELRRAESNGHATKIQKPELPPKARRTRKKAASQSYRDQVSAVVQDAFCSVDDIVTATGLEKKQVRGVLYSPTLGKLYQRKDTPNGKSFKLKPVAEPAE